MRDQPEPPDGCTYVNWLRNHDELDLGLLKEPERDDVMAAFAPDQRMRAFGRGIRRRLAPMLADDRRIAMAHAVAQSLPGAPVMRYGEEIGMGEDLSLPGRAAVRTPMQWSAEKNAGFSKAPAVLVQPSPIRDGRYDFSKVNVAEQELRSGSLMSQVSQLARQRRELGDCPSGRCDAVAFEQRAVFGVLHHRADDAVLMLANLSGDDAELRVPYDVKADLLADTLHEPATKDSVRLAGYGYRWLRVDESKR